MKKCIAVFVLLVMLSVASSAWADDMTAQIDYSALERYVQSWNAAAEEDGIAMQLFSSNADDCVALGGTLLSPNPHQISIVDSLTDKSVPVDLLIQYLSFTDSVAVIYSRSEITEIPKSVEIYADGINCGGMVIYYPAQNEDETELYTLEFDMETIRTILNAQDVFMRLVTEEGTYFQEMSAELTPSIYTMWLLVAGGVDYSTKTSAHYLDASLLAQTSGDDARMTAAPNVQTLSFQTDYEAIDRAAQSVFLLEVYDENNELTGTGSGFVAFDSGTLITNEHVIDGAAYIIAYSDQYKATYKLLNLKAVDKNKDIAILEFDAAAKVKPLTVDVHSRLLRGQPVTAIGSPKGVLNTVSSGNISNVVYYSDEIPDYIQFTAPISPGSSGGALFGQSGAVVGLCVSYLREGEAMYYAIPMKYVEEMYLNARDKGRISLAQYNDLSSELQDIVIRGITQNDECIDIKWTKVNNAENYEIYRRRIDEKDFSLIATVQSYYSYSDKDVIIGCEYEYYVKATHGWCSPSVSEIVKITMVKPTPTPTPKPTPVPTPTPVPQGKVLYEQWDVAEEVLDLKFRLYELGYYLWSNKFDEEYDVMLKNAVMLFQERHHLSLTGVIDDKTYDMLFSPNAAEKTNKILASNSKDTSIATGSHKETNKYSRKTYTLNDSGDEVLRLKEKLKSLGYYRPTSTFDNEYNKTMVERVKQFQKNNALPQTGTIDYVTLIKIYGATCKKGQWYVAPTPKPTPEKAVTLEIPNGSYGEWEYLSGDKLKFHLQVRNASSTKTIEAYELYVYTVDVWGNRLNTKDYTLSVTSTLKPGQKKYSSYITLPNRSKIDRVYVAVHKVKYTNGTIKTVDYHNYSYWEID